MLFFKLVLLLLIIRLCLFLFRNMGLLGKKRTERDDDDSGDVSSLI